MKRLILLVSIGLVTCVAAAQQNDRRRFESEVFSDKDRITEAVDEAFWQWGALFVSPSLDISETGYDDNVFSTETGAIDDYSAKPGLAFDAFLRLSPRWIWKNTAGYHYAYYADLDNLRTNQLETETRLYGLFQRAYFDIGAGWEQDRQRLNSEIDERVQTERFEISAKLSIDTSPRGSLSFRVRTYELEVDDEDFTSAALNNLERESDEYIASYAHRFSLAWWPYLELVRTDFNFTQVGNPRDGSETERALIGLRNRLEERLHYHFRLGIEDLTFPAAPAADSSELYAESFIRYRTTRQTTVEVGLQRYPLFSGTNDYLFYTSLRASLTWIFETRAGWEWAPEIVVGINEYENPIQPVSIVREDDIRAARFRIGIPIRNAVRLDLAFGYQERDSNLPDLSDEGVTAYLDFSVRPKRR